ATPQATLIASVICSTARRQRRDSTMFPLAGIEPVLSTLCHSKRQPQNAAVVNFFRSLSCESLLGRHCFVDDNSVVCYTPQTVPTRFAKKKNHHVWARAVQSAARRT